MHMLNSADEIRERIKRIRHNVLEAKAKYRQPSDNVEIMAVTKTVPAELVNIAIEEGITLLGENKVQEYLSKKDLYNQNSSVDIIGHLQTNKVKYVIDSVEIIQSVDSLKLAQEINKRAKTIDKVQKILIEVNIGNEESKTGIRSDELENLLKSVALLENIRVKGLMSIPPSVNSEEFLFKMNNLYIDISEKKLDNIDMSILSMGMSGDYDVAIKHGSNLVRIGSAIFGKRNYL